MGWQKGAAPAPRPSVQWAIVATVAQLAGDRESGIRRHVELVLTFAVGETVISLTSPLHAS